MENIKIEKNGHIYKITISRPKYLNALNCAVIHELNSIVDEIKDDNYTNCIIITGEGEKAFVAGADISEMVDMDVYSAREFSRFGSKVFRKIELLDKPVIAAVNGYAFGGGCELALCCDIIIASENAVFGQPEVSLGITPGFGGTQRLPKRIGTGRAKELLFTGRSVKAEEALRLGLVNAVYPRNQLLDECIKLADKISQNAPIAVRTTKIAINEGMQVDMDTAIGFETELFGSCFYTEDQKNAMRAFLGKLKTAPL